MTSKIVGILAGFHGAKPIQVVERSDVADGLVDFGTWHFQVAGNDLIPVTEVKLDGGRTGYKFHTEDTVTVRAGWTTQDLGQAIKALVKKFHKVVE